jgi:hypothetical protein
LIVDLRVLAPPSLFSGGFAGWWRREGGGRPIIIRFRFLSRCFWAQPQFGVLPVELQRPRSLGYSWRLGVLVLLLAVLRRMESKVSRSAMAPSTKNTPGSSSDLEDLLALARLLTVVVMGKSCGA